MRLTPARRWTLALGVPAALALIGWTSFSFVALAGTGKYSVNETFALHNGALSAHISQGSVTLVPLPGPGDSARLTGQVTYSLIKPQVSSSSSGVNFGCPAPAGICDFDSTLTVPSTASVNLSSGAGDLTVNGGIAGNLTLGTSAGDITADGITSDDVAVRSDAGDITLQFAKAPSNLTVVSSFGDITVQLPSGTSYHVITSRGVGDVSDDLQQSSTSPHSITVSSSVGDITLTSS
jgi:hypothetical protein